MGDTGVPTITITSDDASLRIGETAAINFALSETSTDFSVDDVTASGGTLSGFTGTGAAYTATFTPTANSTADGVVSVAANTFEDGAQNHNPDGASVTMAVDTEAPTIAITSGDTSLTFRETAAINFALSETSTDFSVDDVTASGGTLSGFTGTGATYTATFTPTADSTTDGLVSVASGAFTDAAGNASTGDASVSMTVNTVPPPAPAPAPSPAPSPTPQPNTPTIKAPTSNASKEAIAAANNIK